MRVGWVAKRKAEGDVKGGEPSRICRGAREAEAAVVVPC